MYKLIITFIFFIIIPIQLFADQNDKRLNYLFDKLVIAKEEQEIHKLTNQIWKIWHEIDDPTTVSYTHLTLPTKRIV